MWNGSSCNKKFINIIIVIFSITFFLAVNPKVKNYIITQKNCYGYTEFQNNKENQEDNKSQSDKEAEVEKELNDKIDDILGDIDSSELDEYLENDFDIDFINSSSFLGIVKKLLSNNYFTEYQSLFLQIVGYFFDNIKEVFLFFFSIFVLIILNQVFDTFCEGKYYDFKNVINIIFSLIISIEILTLFKELTIVIEEVITKIFAFSEKLFPTLLSLILLSGANGTHSLYSSLASFLTQTGLYVFKFVLFPIVSSIIILSIVSVSFDNNTFSKLNSLLKSVFKYIIMGFFAVLGIFSTINLFSSGLSDGVNYRLTKFALKSYVPIIGGYISDGFDFVHTCLILVKNSFGLCGIIVLFFTILKPFIVCAVYIFMFKILSVCVSLFGKEKYANYFEGVSSSFSYYLSILIGVFLCIFIFVFLLILSVTVV